MSTKTVLTSLAGNAAGVGSGVNAVKSGTDDSNHDGTPDGNMNGIAQSGASQAVGAGNTAVSIIEDTGSKLPKANMGLGAASVGTSLWGLANDQKQIDLDLKKHNDVKVSTALSTISNTLGLVAGAAAFIAAVATSPAWAPVAATVATVGSIATSIGSSYLGLTDSELTIGGGLNNLAKAIDTALNPARAAATDGMETLADNVNTAIQKTEEWLKKQAEYAQKTKEALTQTIKDGIKEGLDEAAKAVKTAQDAIAEAVKEIAETIGEIGEAIKDALDDAAKAIIDAVKDAAQAAADAIAKAAESFEKAWEKFTESLPDFTDPDTWANWLPDAFNPWKDANREGKHYFYDPLVLDLDGDGIETIKLNSQDANVNAYFDFDGDGLAHATGWIKKDDGMLVRDINGDGVINNGTEVFGDSTIKRDGTTAKHGFDALVDLDDNGDGLINADDSAFGTLKIWRDINADGVSQADELFSLNTLGITSLNANYEDTNRVIAGGKLAQLGSYSKGDKTYAMGDVDFSFSGVHSRYQDRISLNDTVRALPILAGVGRLRDLRKIRE